jgi:uncharacterized protein
MRTLFDVNMLLALWDEKHIHHARAHEWWSVQPEQWWASCALTQNGFVRVISQPSYGGSWNAAEGLAVLDAQINLPTHEFWHDEVSLADEGLFDRQHILGPRQITDIYLLGLAVKHAGRLATLDRTIPLSAVRLAKDEHLAIV